MAYGTWYTIVLLVTQSALVFFNISGLRVPYLGVTLIYPNGNAQQRKGHFMHIVRTNAARVVGRHWSALAPQ